MKKLLITIFCSFFVLSACSEVIQTPPVDLKTPLFESAQDYFNRNNAEKEAIGLVANQFGYDSKNILMLKSEKKNWSDSCLDLPNVDENCSSVIVPGYLFLLFAENNIFEVHTDSFAQNMRVINYLSHLSSPIDVAIQYLFVRHEIPIPTISVTNFEPVQWPDSCLGIVDQDTMCAPVITPGYLIELTSEGRIFEFHTDFYGSRMILKE
jgi:hypothetical protein